MTSDPFDPTTIAKMGIDAAAECVERFLEFGRTGWLRTGPVDRGAEPDHDEPAEDPKRKLRRLQADADRIIELTAEMTRLMVGTALGVAEETVSVAEPPEGLELGPIEAGSSAHATVWMHMLDGPPSGTTALHASPLAHHSGVVLPPATVTFAPPRLDTLKVQTTIPVTVTASIPAGTAAGSYVGYILADGLPEVVLPLRVEVVTR